MHMKNKGPVLIPLRHIAEVEKLSKAALMDVVWSLAARCSQSADDAESVMTEFRAEWEVVKQHRK